MKAWIKTLWSAVPDGLWFLPAVFTVTAAILAVAVMAAEGGQNLWSGRELPWWLYQGSTEGARMVLNTITGSLITVTGVIFSVTIVAVQLASTQYTPRVLRNFSADRGNQLVFAVFIGTFTYAVLVLRTVRSQAGQAEEFVPRLGVTIAVALVIVSVAALIYFINHLARKIKVTAIIDRVALETMGNVHQLFPEHVGRSDESPPPDPRRPEHSSVTVSASRAGYVQIVDEESLFDLSCEKKLVIGMEPKIGDYVLQNRLLASVWAEGSLDEDLERAIRQAFVLGPERTPLMDVEFGILQISDIAVKSLSPSINDPRTAVRCIDRLGEVLAELGARSAPEPRRTRDGVVRFIASYTTFDRAVKVAFDEIRHFGASIPLVSERLLRVLADIATLVPPSRREPVVLQAQAVLHSARETITNPWDREALEEAARVFSARNGSLRLEPGGSPSEA